ncbi:hypothetical protein QIW53_07820 [Pseudomonas fluorescens]|uniref:hypothetical protein n=1 Tax=Pseudomonas fluorescens TaxID=294 RepID=UPI0035239744
MPELKFEQIKALPKGSGHLFAKTRRWDPSDPRSTFDTAEVGAYSEDLEAYQAFAIVDQPPYHSSIVFEIAAGTQSGVHSLGPGSIEVRYHVRADADAEVEYYRAVSGEINLTTYFPSARFDASDFRFVARRESTGELVEVYLGNFKISPIGQ